MSSFEQKVFKDVFDSCMMEVLKVNKANGWFTENRSFGEDVALLHSEVSEMLEAYRVWGTEDPTPPLIDSPSAAIKPEGIGSEMADVFIRLMDTCYRYNIDLSYEFTRKLEYNKTRGYRHGSKKL
jgi:NTP pyrophosphatase (non-canonical NTP hydrolase)